MIPLEQSKPDNDRLVIVIGEFQYWAEIGSHVCYHSLENSKSIFKIYMTDWIMHSVTHWCYLPIKETELKNAVLKDNAINKNTR